MLIPEAIAPLLLLWSGTTALVVSTWLLMMLRRFHATQYLPRAYWSCLFFGGVRDASLLTAGMLRMVVMVAVVPCIYALIFTRLGGAEALNGAALGSAHGLLAGLALPVAARRCDAVARPGLMGWRLGRATPVVLLLVHAAYGATLGYIYVLPLP